ncbi:MAG: ThuA domain-containing protein [Clostridia bacterium]|nr:ThuA domain-containing protein [Clostridia bacterium]
MKVLVWNEYKHERENATVAAVYPKGIHGQIADFLAEAGHEVRCATLDGENCGITKELLEWADVLIWWGHMAHHKVPDEVAYMVRDAVLGGLGAIFLHSAHKSKPFMYLLGTSANLTWRESGDSETLWVIEPGHPITRGIDRYFTLPAEETYGEPFVIPTPDKLLLIGNFSGGEVFRSGCLFERGNGKIFYLQPGHETFPTYYDKNVQLIIKNAVEYLKSDYRTYTGCPHVRKNTDSEPYVI